MLRLESKLFMLWDDQGSIVLTTDIAHNNSFGVVYRKLTFFIFTTPFKKGRGGNEKQ